ncbi:hypothetical protein BDV93DRAFT_325368 [Ceratobasidium sp. AG-I]|nr:hypothetical protein BDV93DRAFT_325368 [Ceratobasidium sp. AG-I]
MEVGDTVLELHVTVSGHVHKGKHNSDVCSETTTTTATRMSRPAWMTDDLEEEWVEPEWDAEEDLDVVPEETSSQGSRRSRGGSKERPPHAYGSARIVSTSTASGSDAGSVRERSVRDLLGTDGIEGARRKGAPAAGLTLERGTAPPGAPVTPDASPTAGTFLVREDIPAEPLKAVPAVLGLKKSGVKNFFSPLALERMFEPPSPPANNSGGGAPASQSQPEPQPQSQPRPTSPSPPPGSPKTISIDTQTSNGTPPTDISLTPPKSASPINTTPSPHAPAYNHSLSFASTSSSPPLSQLSFTPSPSAGRGPLGTFRLPRNPHAPIRPSRLSESHLVKPYASFEGDESSHSSIPQNILDDQFNPPPPDTHTLPEPSISPSININEDEDEERLTNDFEFGDDEFEVGDDAEGEEADSILDPTNSKFEQGGGQVQGGSQGKGKGQGGQGKEKQVGTPIKANGTTTPDEILDTDIPGLALFDGRKLSASYQFTFASPRRDGPGPSSRPGLDSGGASSGDGGEGKPRSKRKEDRKREREEERERRNVTRALLHPHEALRSITPETDMGESRPSSRASDVSASERAESPYSENQTRTAQFEDQSRNYASPSGVNTSHSHTQFSRDDQGQFSVDDQRQRFMRGDLSRDDQRTPSPNLLPPRDPRLKLFQFHYDTFTRDHLSALVDSIAVGSVGSSPSVQVRLVS